MTGKTPTSGQCGTTDTGALALTDGEIHFLWWFIQGGIMTQETWDALLRGFGFCERHAWAHLNVEMAFREEHLLGPVILYRGLIEKALQAIQPHHKIWPGLHARQLQAAGPCFLCALNLDHASGGAAPPARLERGRDSGGLRAFAIGLAPLWRLNVCAVCAGQACDAVTSRYCRPHLLADQTTHRPFDVSSQQATLQELSMRLARYEESFAAGSGDPSDQDRAALISAVGWCSGWRPLLVLLGDLGSE